MTLMERLKRKQKADEARREARLEKRRGYARADRLRERAARLAESGLDDLPDEIAISIEDALETRAPEGTKPADAAPVENLVARLASIKERILRLHAVFAVSLSFDAAIEANRFLAVFQDLAQQLQTKDAAAYDNLVRGHESLLLSPPIPVRQTVPLDTQRMCELRWEVSRSPVRHVPMRPTEGVPDGLGWML